jgi:hypothetical protein
MKKKIFLILFFLGSFYTDLIAQPLYDSIYYWHWNTNTIGWNITQYEKDINFVYDANNNLLSRTQQYVSSAALISFTYDANNNQTSYLSQQWNCSAWLNVLHYIYV